MIIGIDVSHANKIKRTGVEEYCFQIVEELKKIIPSDTKVILYSSSPLVAQLSQLPKNWELKILGWPFKKLWSQLRLAYELFRHPPDIYFSPGQLMPFISPKNTVVMVHDSAFEAYPFAYRFLGRQYLKWMNRLIIKKAKLILTSTQFNKQEMLKFYGHYFTDQIDLDDKIKVVPLAYDQSKFVLQPQDEDNFYGRYILSIGRLEEKKNTKRIVSAFSILKKNDNNLKLILVGTPGAGYEEVEKIIVSSPYKNDIILLGFVSPVSLVSILKNAQVFVFPSLYEGFGIPILEAMAMGVPVVASNNSAFNEVGGDALAYVDALDVCDMADKILLLLSDNNIRQEKIKKGLEMVKKYSWRNTAQLTWDIIKNIN